MPSSGGDSGFVHDSAQRPLAILARFAPPDSWCLEVLTTHSVLVTQLALEIARAYRTRHPETAIDTEFIREASLLHDIGIVKCDAPEIGCHGSEPYIRHGVLGREILEAEGLRRHALVCERHTGSGISRDEVAARALPLPPRDYLPLSLEEKIICVADKFYGKNPRKLWKRRRVEKIDAQLREKGDGPHRRWAELKREFLPRAEDPGELGRHDERGNR